MEIYILRHGIAETAGAWMSDADRALVPEGKKKLKVVLRLARAAGVRPAHILTSPYRRALETAEIAAEELGYEGKLTRCDALRPGSEPEEVWAEVRGFKPGEQILLSGHEPLLSYLAAFLLDAPSLRIDLKKGSLLRIDMDRFGAQPRGVLRWYLTPKLALAAGKT